MSKRFVLTGGNRTGSRRLRNFASAPIERSVRVILKCPLEIAIRSGVIPSMSGVLRRQFALKRDDFITATLFEDRPKHIKTRSFRSFRIMSSTRISPERTA